jgi:cell division protein FtsB
VCRTLKSKMYHFTRAAKDQDGRAKKHAEDIRKLTKENEELKQQVADLAYKYKSAQGYLQRHLSPDRNSPAGHGK